jgi:hypothetical protein
MPDARPMQADYDQLKLLGIFTIAHGVIGVVAGVVTFVYMCFIGIATAVSDSDSFAAGFLAVCGFFIGGLFVVKGSFLALSGWGLLEHKWRTLSHVGAVVACIDVPIGTALAVFTFIVLDRPGVRAIYAGKSPAPFPMPAPAPATRPYAKRDTKPDSPLRVRVAS